MARVDFKRKMLSLLKEDEEFRYAVIGILGIEDIRRGQARLEAAVAKLEEAVQRLTERQGALEAAVEKLTERQGVLEEAVQRLTERQGALEAAFQKLVERQGALEAAVQRLAEAQARTEVALQELYKQVGRLSETIGFGLEDIARVVVPGWLHRHEEIEVEDLVRKFVTVDGEEIEINLYGEGYRKGVKTIIIGEARSRIYSGDVEEFDKVAEKARKALEGSVYKLMFAYYVHPSAEKEASNRGITLIASYMR